MTNFTVAGTGHRPNKLGGYSPEALEKLITIARQWMSANKPTHVISGMALGWDTAVALAALKEGIHLTCAVPFKGQEKMWPAASQDVYNSIISACNELKYISSGDFTAAKMMFRNAWMVDHCDTMLAMWDGSMGGTYNCVKYAQMRNRPIINLWEVYLHYGHS